MKIMQLSHLSRWLFCFRNSPLAAKWQQIFFTPISISIEHASQHVIRTFYKPCQIPIGTMQVLTLFTNFNFNAPSYVITPKKLASHRVLDVLIDFNYA